MRMCIGLLLLLVGLVAPGCHRAEAEAPVEQAALYGELPGLRGTTDLPLRDELARIEEEKATPKLLMRNDIPERDNVAAGLVGLVPASKLPLYLTQSADLFPSEAFTFTALGLEKVVRFKNRHAHLLQHVDEALTRPRCNFGIRFVAGFGADLRFIDVVQLAARLEAFEAAERLSKSDLEGAVEAVQRMLRLSACLAGERHITPRLQGAYIRTEALTVLQALVQHAGLKRKHLEELATTFAEELTDWPADANAWVGDRALGLHAYELVRAGKTAMLLTQEEAARVADKSRLADLAMVAKQSVDADERYYLQAMRRMIEACSQPYYARQALFAELFGDLQQRENSPDYPLVAGKMLLTEIQQGQAVQAQDRANCEAWALALAQAIGQPAPAYRSNPLTGEAYRVVQEQGRIVVGNLNSDPKSPKQVTVVVPDLSQTPSDSRRTAHAGHEKPVLDY